jgi:surface protein
MGYMFGSAKVFNQDISRWNTAKVTNMVGMFYEADAFNRPIGNWNTAAVPSMASMFQYAHAFNQPIGNWSTAAVTNMGYMFGSASAFNQDISRWNTDKVTDMVGMFQYASAFNQAIGNLGTGKVTKMYRMFYGASRFNQALCWTLYPALRDDTSIFLGTGCPLISLYDPAGLRNCWGTGMPTNCTPMPAATLRPTASPTIKCQMQGGSCHPKDPPCCPGHTCAEGSYKCYAPGAG